MKVCRGCGHYKDEHEVNRGGGWSCDYGNGQCTCTTVLPESPPGFQPYFFDPTRPQW